MLLLSPKADGAWNLHKATLGQLLDFFFLARSVVSLTYQPGQGNYSSANGVLEVSCQYRQRLGPPASVLASGPIKGVSFVEENLHTQKRIRLATSVNISTSWSFASTTLNLHYQPRGRRLHRGKTLPISVEIRTSVSDVPNPGLLRQSA